MTRTHRLLLGLLIAAAAALGATSAVALGADAEAVESARDSLSGGSYPWYDAESDGLRRVDVPVGEEPGEEDPGIRGSKWERDVDSNSPKSEPIRGPRASLGGFGSVFMGLFWCVIAVVLIGLIVLIVWAFMRREVWQSAVEVKADTSREVDRLEELPFAVKRPQSNLLEEARRLYEAGKFAEAIIYLFSYELVELDKHQVIRLAKGKTNRQYLGEARRKPGVLPVLEDTMVAFEDVFFGRHALERERFEACWRRLDDFQRSMQGAVV